MAQCAAQHTVDAEVRYCLRQVEDGHLVHVDYRHETFAPESPKTGAKT